MPDITMDDASLKELHCLVLRNLNEMCELGRTGGRGERVFAWQMAESFSKILVSLEQAMTQESRNVA